MDNELIEATSKIKNNSDKDNFLEEHKFIANCLQAGFTISDLKSLEYKDVAKILIILSSDGLTSKTQKASQADIDKLFR